MTGKLQLNKASPNEPLKVVTASERTYVQRDFINSEASDHTWKTAQNNNLFYRVIFSCNIKISTIDIGAGSECAGSGLATQCWN